MNKAKKPISPLKQLMNKVRKTEKYQAWKEAISLRDFPKGAPKGIQIHHCEHNFSWYFKEYNLLTLKDALKCKALWNAPGISLTRGEHFALTRIALYKYPTKGFVQLLAQELERLQEAQYHTRPEKKNVKTNR